MKMRFRLKYIALACAGIFFQPALRAQQKPNIIFIMADDLGYGELGSYGNTFNETPNLDAMANNGLRFTNAYAAAPVCSPTRASFITGQFPARVRITDFLPGKTDRWLDPAKYVTINEALEKQGYHTGIIGKWHLDTDYKTNKGGPVAHGFDEVIGTETKYIADGDYFFPYQYVNTFTDAPENEYLTDRQNQEAVQFIERNKKESFFLYLSYYSVHTRLDAPENLVNKYKKKFDQKYGTGAAAKTFGANDENHQAGHPDNPWLAAMLERIDVGVGNIMRKLKEAGLDKNTLVVFFSDNGGAGKLANNGPLRMGKTWLYEGGIRECLLMQWNGMVKPGSVSDFPVTSLDFYPGFVELAGGNVNDYTLDGYSFVSLLKGKSPAEKPLYWHYPSETGKWKPRMASAVRSGDFKLIRFYNNPHYELYNLKEDIGEKNDLSKKMPAKTKELQALLEKWLKEVDAEKPLVDAE